MKRIMALTATVGALVVLCAGAALAASINCPTGPAGNCYGTNSGDAV